MDSDEKIFKFKEKGKEIYDLVSKYKQLNSKSKIIEIGCGIGVIISYFHDLGLSTKTIVIIFFIKYFKYLIILYNTFKRITSYVSRKSFEILICNTK